jgi:hypothetical protein
VTPIRNFDRPNWFFTFSKKCHNKHKHKISKHVFVDCRVIKLCPITNFQLNQTAFYFSFQKGSPCTSKVINPFLDIFHCSILKYFLDENQIYSHLSYKRDVTLTDFGKVHPTQNKNPPCTFIDYITDLSIFLQNFQYSYRT